MNFRWGMSRLLLVALGAGVAVVPGAVTSGNRVSAANDMTPWASPSMPPLCTATQTASGNVTTCLLDGPNGRPESRGWPTPPFPTPDNATTVPWVDLAMGATGSRVTTLQKALIASGYVIAADGMFGAITGSAVRKFQVMESLAETGVVDQPTAGALGILVTGGGTFPPAGFTWIGWSYNGSPALASWEAQMVGNPLPIGVVAAKQLRSLPDALPLFVGFIKDVSAGGYKITDAGTYAFRCTSNSRKDCDGQSRDEMSNHAYGLALDINTSANPELTYTGVGTATACATTVKTDIPMWMVVAAQKWGLYWAGYGWNGGCLTPAQVKSSVLRDSMHFEFRGTPAQARTIAAFNLTGNPGTPATSLAPPAPPVPPPSTKTCLNLVDDAGLVSSRCLAPAEVPDKGWRTVITTQAPAGATAAVVNITLTGATTSGYVTAEPCAATSGAASVGDRRWSNGNSVPGLTTANLSVVPIDANGAFCLYQSQPGHTIVDVQGFFAPSTASPGGGNLLTAVAPRRMVDTRTQTYCAPNGTCGKPGPVPANTELMVAASAVPASAVALLANLTITGPVGSGYVTADACSALVIGPQTRSNTNFVAGSTVANLAVVPTTSSTAGAQMCSYTSATTQKAIDLQGYFAPAAAGGWGFALSPSQRLLDTRNCQIEASTGAQQCATPNAADTIVRVQGPAGESAVLVNLTLTDAMQAGYATADKCSALVAGPQTKSNSNMTVGKVVANVAVVPLDPDGGFCVYLSASAHLVVDLQGTFSATAALRFNPITPVRRHYSRELNTP